MPDGRCDHDRWCPTCQGNITGTKKAPAHNLHVILAILTGGLWLFVYAWILLTPRGRYRCIHCGGELPGVVGDNVSDAYRTAVALREGHRDLLAQAEQSVAENRAAAQADTPSNPPQSQPRN